MPSDPESLEAAAHWLRYARADLALAGAALPEGGLYESLCFHAQQAAEKSLKAVFVREGVEFEYTHDLQTLVDQLPAHISRTPALRAAVRLTPYAVSARYPGEGDPVEESEYRTALQLAESVVQWAEACMTPEAEQ
jgi:HEPN domain-containing protein